MLLIDPTHVDTGHVLGELFGVDEELPEWCCCGNCTDCSRVQAVCCNHRPASSLCWNNNSNTMCVVGRGKYIFSRDLIASRQPRRQ